MPFLPPNQQRQGTEGMILGRRSIFSTYSGGGGLSSAVASGYQYRSRSFALWMEQVRRARRTGWSRTRRSCSVVGWRTWPRRSRRRSHCSAPRSKDSACAPSQPSCTSRASGVFPSPTHSFIPGLKPSFSAILPAAAFPFLLQD